ncbi:MAG: hypothetical protein K2W95_09030 [Candidatus Obscuribacterales bacterium]|nr:hypothetical protein [Candidatus Obscuribacterales bacterium]
MYTEAITELFLSNPFELAGNPAQISRVEPSQPVDGRTAARLYALLRQGSFARSRNQIIDIFITAGGGKSQSGQPVNLKAIIALCLTTSAESFKSKNVRQQLTLWFDPFTGRIELQTSDGLRDSLTVWTKLSNRQQ